MATVTVVYHFEDGLWWAESPEVPEFSGGGDTFAEARTMAREGLAFALGHDVDLDERFDEAARAALQRGMSVQAFGLQVFPESASFAPQTAHPGPTAVASVQHPRRGVATSAA